MFKVGDIVVEGTTRLRSWPWDQYAFIIKVNKRTIWYTAFHRKEAQYWNYLSYMNNKNYYLITDIFV